MDYRSRTQKKKEALSLQELGARLLELSSEQLEGISLPEDIHGALTFARTITSHGARRRQMQYIGTLMRTVDPGPIQEALDTIDAGNYKKARAFKEVEKWRDELVAGNDLVIQEISEKCPGTDPKQIEKLVLQARREQAEHRPPKASRMLFRYLNKAREG